MSAIRLKLTDKTGWNVAAKCRSALVTCFAHLNDFKKPWRLINAKEIDKFVADNVQIFSSAIQIN